MNTYFITGATGFLGSSIVKELIVKYDSRVYVLIRAKDYKAACSRLERLWWEQPEIMHEVGKKIIPVTGDITAKNLGIEEDVMHELENGIDYIIHAAAEVDIREKREKLEGINIEGTQNVLDFAEQVNKLKPIKRFSFVSTAYTAGALSGKIEEVFNEPAEFLSIYEETKYRAEMIVRKYFNEFPISIFRPAQIVGNSKTGFITNFNTVYYPLKLYMTGKINLFPVNGKMKLNIVTVDYVTNAILRITLNPKGINRIFHLVSNQNSLPSLKELILYSRDWAIQSHQIHLKKPYFIGIPFLEKLGKLYNRFCCNKSGSMITNIISLLPYSSGNKVFSNTNTLDIINEECPEWQKYIAVLLEYAVYKGYLNHSGRTVFEQVMYRLKSKKNPVTYYNISANSLEKVKGFELSKEINNVVTSLINIGVRKGTRVAIIGNASTRYLAVDIALGLIGAISVPLYFTTPVSEISNYMKLGESQIIFVGSLNVLNKVNLLDQNLQIVAMCEIPKEAIEDHRILSWDSFLNTEQALHSNDCNVSFSDIATIRFTSGSTGQPKGVVFDHYNLKWMSESLASLLSWKIRNSDTRYLSFLPMSHVVEGILATYGSFYSLCKLDIYYLGDFNRLSEMLPKVKPTFFFSVPRFYEKLWDKFSQSKFAAWYIVLPESFLKTSLKSFLRTILLKKSGLNKCLQLVVGSAPISNDLIYQFRKLGVEIHNAYGLTEAPLITLNRLGDNKIGTVGPALPQTEIRIEADGEIAVRGPQVTKAYFNSNKNIYNDGFFRTGDFGELTLDGKLVITGRKKDLIITSYGKNIQPSKIECLLMGIRSVTNAMLVGEGLPYCTAIIWVDRSAVPGNMYEYFSDSIVRINNNLSSPEMIRKWAIVGKTLTIASGELTPNLKLRRDVILKNYNDVILSLYKDADVPEYTLCAGSFH